MIDLTERLGLPIYLIERDDGWYLKLGDGVKSEMPRSRPIDEMKPVLRNPAVDTPHVLYWMFRDVRHVDDEATLQAKVPLLRYDVSVYNGGVMSVGGQPVDGDEFVKSFGHYHPYLRGKHVSFPEVYEVVWGKMLFVLQEPEDVFNPSSGVRRVQIVEIDATQERVLVVTPPNFGHVVILIDDGPVVTCNWIARVFDSQYAPFRILRGGAYYIVKRGDDWTYEPNPNYGQLPLPEVLPASALDTFDVPNDEPLYRTCLRNPDSFAFLLNPPEPPPPEEVSEEG